METFIDEIACEEFYETEDYLQWLEELELDYVNSLLQLASDEQKQVDF